MSVQPHNPEFHPEVRFLSPEEANDLADRAYLAPESLDGAQRHTLKGDGITRNPNLLKPMGENGPLAILELGKNQALKVYGHKYEGKWRYTVTPGRYDNDDTEDRGRVLNMVFIDGSMTFGREVDSTKYTLGIAKDDTISRNHFIIEPSDDQIRIQDLSSNGTKITFVEEEPPKLHQAVNDAYRARKLGGIVVPK